MIEPSYLILHKVRGEPAFDVAHKMDICGEEAWIVTTSGHRAWPARTWPIEDLADISDINRNGGHTRPYFVDYNMIEALRDHYQVLEEPKRSGKATGKALGALKRLGLIANPQEEERRA